MKSKWFIRLAFVVCTVGILGGGGCPQEKQVSASGATQVTSFTQVPKNSRGNTVEQQNILDRIRITTDPTKVMWIHILSINGTIITRMPVRNKITSSGKRLEPRTAVEGAYLPLANSTDETRTNELIQPDGTYGDSTSYEYWFDPMGRYIQMGTSGGLGYILTDFPIDLSNPQDKITGMYNTEKAAYDWQKLQEIELRAKESKTTVSTAPTQSTDLR